MTLSFTTKWPKKMGADAGKPNHFTNKIAKGVWQNYPKLFNEHTNTFSDSDWNKFDKIKPFENISEYDKERLYPKIHTIRNDKNNRWKVGSKIHPVINNRTKNRFQFTPTLEVKGIQRIEIEWTDLGSLLGREALIYIDNIKCVGKYSEIDKYHYDFPGQSLQNLALNDGFESVEQFFSWFNKDFNGKIIHWTNLTY